MAMWKIDTAAHFLALFSLLKFFFSVPRLRFVSIFFPRPGPRTFPPSKAVSPFPKRREGPFPLGLFFPTFFFAFFLLKQHFKSDEPPPPQGPPPGVFFFFFWCRRVSQIRFPSFSVFQVFLSFSALSSSPAISGAGAGLTTSQHLHRR